VATTATVRRCEIIDCYSELSGGGVHNQYGDLWLRQCRLTGNVAHFRGGGAINAKLDSCLVTFNTATNGGGTADCELYNCTVYTNIAALGGGTYYGSAFNSIVTFNVSSTPDNGDYVGTVFRDSCTFPLPSGTGNISISPVLLDPDVVPNYDFLEFITSPCINRGNPEYVVGPVDLFGNNRQFDGLPDMGASEFTFLHLPARVSIFYGSLAYGPVQAGFDHVRTLWVYNRGNTLLTVSGFTVPLNFSASMADMTVNPGESNAVMVTFMPDRDGYFYGTLEVFSDKTWGDSVINVSGMGIPSGINVYPESFFISTFAGSNPDNRYFQVVNTGTLSLPFSVAANQPWLHLTPTAGNLVGSPVGVTIGFDAAALSPGLYGATVTVLAPGATNSPLYVPVSLTVIPTPTLVLSHSAVTAVAPVGANATSQVFQVRNSGPGDMGFTVTTDDGEWESMSPKGSSWLTVSPASGTSSGNWVSVTIGYDSAGLPNGVYTGRVRVASPGAIGSPHVIAVRLTVGTPYIPVTVTPANWHVGTTGSDVTGDGSAGNPFATIARAVSAAADGQVIQVATGVYTQTGVAIRKNLTIRGGGWNSTIIQPVLPAAQEWEGRLFFVDGVHVEAAFENLWLRNGFSHAGSALLAVGSTVTVTRCRMSGNTSTLDGGGAVRNLNGTVTLKSCILDRNTSAVEGGATYGCELDQCLVAYNTAQSGGGTAGGRLTFCTVAYNTGGGMQDGSASNSIVIFNTGGNLENSTAAVSLSDPAPDGAGSMGGDPLFEGGTNGDFHLDLVSPAINSEASAAGLPALDLYGRPRVVGLLPDLGPLEKQYFVPTRRMVLYGNLAFGSVQVGSSMTQTLWVVNNGNTNLGVSAIETPEGFSVSTQSFSVAAGSSNAVVVIFTPPAAGPFGGSVMVMSDAQNSPVSLSASGTGTIFPPVLGLTPPVLHVTVVEGSNASNETVTVLNALHIGSMNFTVVSDVGWISPVPASGSSTGESVAVTLVFHVNSLVYGFYTGLVTVASSQATNSPQSMQVLLTVRPGSLPSKPVPIAPAEGTVVFMTNSLPFTWSSAPRAEQYHVWIGTNGHFFADAWTTGESATNVAVPAFFKTGTYLWMVAGSNWLGYGPWSTTVTFKVARLVSPTGGIILPPGTTPEFRWTETPGATAYRLKVQRYDKASAVWVNYMATNGLAPAGLWIPASAFPKGSYRWSLREQEGAVWGEWDPWAYFQIALPAFPKLLSPLGDLYIWKNVPFQWGSVPTATAYQLQVLLGGATYYNGPWQSETEGAVLLQSFPATYRWRARAKNSYGVGAWSPSAKIVRKALSGASGLSPNGVTYPFGSLITFSWDAVPGATKFDLVVKYGGDVIATYRLLGADSRTYTASLPLDAGNYTWQVRPGNIDGWGPWSYSAAFYVR
jgi:hypothetical protein